MSWDVLLLHVPEGITTFDELDDVEPQPLGPLAEVVSRLQAVCSTADFSDPTWGELEAADYSIEFNIGKDDPVESVMLHMRGGDEVISVLAAICAATGWSAVDTEGGEFIHFDNNPSVGLQQWRTYRDHATDDKD